MEIARHRLLVAFLAGCGSLCLSFVVTWAGLIFWEGSMLPRSLGAPLLLVPLVLCAVLARVAGRATVADVVLDESLKWTRRALEAIGVLMDDPPIECRQVRHWDPGWSPWLSVPFGWAVIVVLNCYVLLPLIRALVASQRSRRAAAWRKADEALDAYASAIDGVTLCSPTGTYFGCLVHPVPHAVRTRLILDRFLEGMVWGSVPGCVWGGVLLAMLPFGQLWAVTAGVHLAGIALLWGTGVLRIRCIVATAWQEQQKSTRFTLRSATSERDLVMRLVEESTWEGP